MSASFGAKLCAPHTPAVSRSREQHNVEIRINLLGKTVHARRKLSAYAVDIHV
jgi:hypothetical protein